MLPIARVRWQFEFLNRMPWSVGLAGSQSEDYIEFGGAAVALSVQETAVPNTRPPNAIDDRIAADRVLRFRTVTYAKTTTAIGSCGKAIGPER